MIGRKRSRKRAHSESRIQFTYMHFPTSFPFLSPAFFIRFGFYIRFLLAVSTRRPPPSALRTQPSTLRQHSTPSARDANSKRDGLRSTGPLSLYLRGSRRR